MLAGAALFVAVFPMLEPVINGLGNLGEVTFPGINRASPWPWVGALVIGEQQLGCLVASLARKRSQNPRAQLHTEQASGL